MNNINSVRKFTPAKSPIQNKFISPYCKAERYSDDVVVDKFDRDLLRHGSKGTKIEDRHICYKLCDWFLEKFNEDGSLKLNKLIELADNENCAQFFKWENDPDLSRLDKKIIQFQKNESPELHVFTQNTENNFFNSILTSLAHAIRDNKKAKQDQGIRRVFYINAGDEVMCFVLSYKPPHRLENGSVRKAECSMEAYSPKNLHTSLVFRKNTMTSLREDSVNFFQKIKVEEKWPEDQLCCAYLYEGRNAIKNQGSDGYHIIEEPNNCYVDKLYTAYKTITKKHKNRDSEPEIKMHAIIQPKEKFYFLMKHGYKNNLNEFLSSKEFCESSNEERISILLARNSPKCFGLIEAIKSGHKDIVKCILESPVFNAFSKSERSELLMAKDQHGNRLLQVALKSHQFNIAYQLLQAQINNSLGITGKVNNSFDTTEKARGVTRSIVRALTEIFIFVFSLALLPIVLPIAIVVTIFYGLFSIANYLYGWLANKIKQSTPQEKN